MPWKHNNIAIKAGTAWSDKDGVQHPANLMIWTDPEKKDKGLTWEDEHDTSFDNRFYTSKNVERKLDDEDAKDADGKQLYQQDGKTKLINEGLKTIWIRQTKETTNNLLSKWDWQIVRKAEKDKAIDSDVANYHSWA